MAAEVLSRTKQSFDYKSYSDLDNCPEREYLLNATHLMATLPGVVKIKLDAISKLSLQPGDNVLEAGCGLGYDAERMQKIVGPTGKVFAVDASETIISLAKKNNPNSKVNYLQTTSPPYQFPDNHFSAIYADRLLVSQADVAGHFSEFYRSN